MIGFRAASNKSFNLLINRNALNYYGVGILKRNINSNHHHYVNNIGGYKLEGRFYSKTIKINDQQEITTSQLLKELSGNVIHFAKSREYSSSFNRLLRHATIDELEKVFKEIQPNIHELCTDSNGSIVMERVILRAAPHQLDIIFDSLFSEKKSREDMIKLFVEENSSRVISKLIPKLKSSHIEQLLGLMKLNSELMIIMLENENSTNLLTQMIEMHLTSLESFLKQPMVQLLLNLDDEQINEQRLRQPLSKSIEKSSLEVKLELIKSLTEDNIVQLDERHSFALSRVYTRIPTNSKEFIETSTFIRNNFYNLSMKRDHKDVINSFIGFSEKTALESLIDSLNVNQIEELLKDKNGLIAFSYLFSRITFKINVLNRLSEKIVDLSKHFTSSFFFSSLAADNRECALAIIEMVKPHLLNISSNKNSQFLSIKLTKYPEGRKALLKSFKYDIVQHYQTCQQVIFHLINECSPVDRSEALKYCILPKFNELNRGDISEPLFKLTLLFIKKGSLNDYTELVKCFEGKLAQMSTERNTSILLQELYQVSPQVIRDIMNRELLGNIEELNTDSITSLSTNNKHSKHLLNTMLKIDPSLKPILSKQMTK